MSPTELWWWLEAKMGVRMVSKGLSEDDAEGLYEFMKERGL